MKPTHITSLLAALLGGSASLALATTDGYFSHGNGAIAKGMGGAATAVALDSFGGANNPATMVKVGDRIDAGLSLFMPSRSATRSGTGGFIDGHAKSRQRLFFIPDFGYNHLLSETLSLGVSVYGNGGMNTNYSPTTLGAAGNLYTGQGKLGVNFQQLIVAPTLSWQFHPKHSFGVSPLLILQDFKAYGLSSLSGMSQNPAAFTDRGHSYGVGGGVRVGWYGQITDWLNLGATYSPQTPMSRFKKYEGLFAQKGGFDVPENFNLGFSLTPSERWLIAFDYERINYSRVRSVGNAGPMVLPFPLGSAKGPGFHWRDVNVLKIGVQYQINDCWTVRAGYNHTTNPIRSSDVTFNMLAPGVVQNHVTAGVTYQLPDEKGAITAFFSHAFRNSTSGPSLLGGAEKIAMHQNEFGLSYGFSW